MTPVPAERAVAIYLFLKSAVRGERLLYRVAGLPVALRWLFHRRSRAARDVIRAAYALAYWNGGWSDWFEIGTAVVIWPLVLIGTAAWFTIRNGPIIRRRDHKAIIVQLTEQLRLYFSDGVLSPWYYIFGLHRGASHAVASGFLHRFETKAGIFPLLRRGVVTELNNKKIFADYCVANGIPCARYLLHLDGGKVIGAELPDCDLFVKPVRARGGTGAERWDRIAPEVYENPAGDRLGLHQLLERLNDRARRKPLLVQRRIAHHRQLADLTTGALPTVRVMTCLDEQGDPEVVAAVLRMAIGANRTVDNLHAGGIAAGIGLRDGLLSRASNLGMDARLGWLTHHPDTGAPIEGRTLPDWARVKALAIQAHRAFADRPFVGWDIAPADGGPIVVEGNSGPDVDIIQRFGTPVCSSRFGELLAWHLRNRGFAA